VTRPRQDGGEVAGAREVVGNATQYHAHLCLPLVCW
jgi:hypothetical protein